MADSIVEGRLRRLIRSLRREGPAHILEVIRHDLRRRRFAASGPTLPDDIGLPSDPDAPADSDTIDRLLDRADHLLFPWKLDAGVRRRTLDALEDAIGDEIERDAVHFAAGRFTALGLSIHEPSGTFDWHRDYATGKVWPRDRFDRITFLSGDGADVKYPWELSRLHGLGWLGLAHMLEPERPLSLTGELPVAAFRRIVEAWISENPFGHGVNWAMPMEVALRGFWLIAAASLFRESPSLDTEWWGRYLRLVGAHGHFLHHTLEYLPNLTNHYIANCFGLVTIGALFAETEGGNRWFHDGRRRLERELHRQVTPDGLHYERSLPYHGLVLELYLVASLIASREGQPLSENSWHIVDRMAAVTRTVTPGPGRPIPLLGDADDGRLLRPSSSTDLYDHSFLLDLHDRAHGKGSGRGTPEGLLLYGRDGTEHRGAGTGHADDRRRGLTLFEEGGLAVIRGASLTCIVDVGPIGLHGNNDTLSFTLFDADGRPYVIDPGTGCYTGNPSLRNELRSTAAHNGIVVDDREVAEFAGLWRVREDRTAPVVVETEPHLVACHHAWADDGIVVERTVDLERPDFCRIIDQVIGSGEHALRCRFTLAPGLSARAVEQGIVIDGNGLRDLRLEVEGGDEIVISEGICSPSYGLILPTTVIEIKAERALPAEILYLWRLL